CSRTPLTVTHSSSLLTESFGRALHAASLGAAVTAAGMNDSRVAARVRAASKGSIFRVSITDLLHPSGVGGCARSDDSTRVFPGRSGGAAQSLTARTGSQTGTPPGRPYHRRSMELGWPMGLEPITFGATIRCSAD